MRKKLLSLVLALCMAISLMPATLASYAEDRTTPKLVLSETLTAPGDEAVITVSTENNPGVGALTLGLEYDESKLELIGFENGEDDFTGWRVKTKATWIGSSDCDYNGVILKLKFKVLDTAPEGFTSVSLKCEEGDASNFNEDPILFEVVSGGINIHTHNYIPVVTEPTCMDMGYTTHICICGDSYKDHYVEPLGHDFGEWVVTTDPNCTEKGVETRYCSRCDAIETREVAALGHDLVHHDGKAATCTAAGWEEYETCTRCDYSTYNVIPPQGHNYTAIVTPPTCTEKGYTTYTCCECGDSYKSSYVKELGHNYNRGICTECGAADPDYVPPIEEGIISVSNERARAGEEVTVSVSIKENPGIMVMVLGLDYDQTKLALIGHEDGLMTGWQVASKAVWTGENNMTEDGIILKLRFKVLEDVEDGDIKVSVLFAEGDIANHDEVAVIPEEIDGTITVYTYKAGDITGDDKINALDLIRLQRYLSGEDVAVAASCDVTGDGRINALDLVRLQRYISGEQVDVFNL